MARGGFLLSFIISALALSPRVQVVRKNSNDSLEIVQFAHQ
jgi:hypothetical protein